MAERSETAKLPLPEPAGVGLLVMGMLGLGAARLLRLALEGEQS